MKNSIENDFEESAVKVGRISYMNVAPVYYGIDNGLKPAWLKLVNGPPSVLNKMMRKGDLDISPVSSVAYAQYQDEWLLLPDLSIACYGKVMSVLLVSNYHFNKLNNKKVVLTDESATAAELLKLIFALKKVRPVFERGIIQDPRDHHNNADAALVIGDTALTGKWNTYYKYVWDLGKIWQELADLPFVFALWAVRKSFAEKKPEVVSSILELFRISMNKGNLNMEHIAASSSKRLCLGINILRKYYNRLCYDLGPLQLKGLKAFFEGLHRENIIDKEVILSFYNDQNYRYSEYNAA